MKAGSVQFVDGELYRPQIFEVNRVEGMRPDEIAFVRLNNTAIATSKSGQIAYFGGLLMATPPVGFNPLTVDDFEVYLNGRRVPASQINSITQEGDSIATFVIEVSIDVPSFFETSGAVLEDADEVVLVGKFS